MQNVKCRMSDTVPRMTFWVKTLKENVTKNIFINGLACPTLGWLTRVMEAKKPATLGEKFLMEQGQDIEIRARCLYPDGFLIKDADPELAHKETIAAIKNPDVSAVFGATFLVDRYVTKADILQRVKGGWILNEVKSGVTDDPKFIDDMAYTAMVAKRSGLKITGSCLFLVSKDFRLGMSNDRLFVKIDHTDEVQTRVALFEPCWETVEKATRAPKKPDAKLRFVCRECRELDLFSKCLGAGIKNHIFDIPRLHENKFEELNARGIVRIEDIPDTYPLTERQAIVRDCVKKNQPFVGAQLGKRVQSLTWPVYYLDFETVTTAFPLYSDIAPYYKIPTQYSVHKYWWAGRDPEHYEFLADPARDCRKEFAQSLIETLGDKGDIVVYGTFEKTILDKLKDALPSFSGKIRSLIGRLVNLEQIVSAGFYHPDFYGRTSIKNVLPVLVSEMSYDSLEIKDGKSAMAAFAYMALGKYKGDEIEEVKKSLKAYCAQDTLALYKVHQRLIEICGSKYEQQGSHHQASLEGF